MQRVNHQRAVVVTRKEYGYITLRKSALRSKLTKTMSNKEEVDLCDIEGSFCTENDAQLKSSDAFVNVVQDAQENDAVSFGFDYSQFAKTYPFANNILIASLKTAAADLLAQAVIAHTPLDSLDWERNLLFGVFGALYLGVFQYAYQVNVFKRLFDVDKFTSQSWEEKSKDVEGLKALAAQTLLDLTVLTVVYLPTFYIFKASVFSDSMDPSVWASTGIENYQTNFSKDEVDLIRGK